MYGILNIYKPPGPTSHDIVNKIRKITKIKKIGHAGTLDPFAEGLLIILIGKATKLQSKFMDMDKTYVATIKMGYVSDTYDKTGIIKSQNTNIKKQTIFKSQIKNILKKFTGEIKQTPPIYSAVKIKGKKAYELARKGQRPNLKPRKVKIYKIKLLKYGGPASTREDSLTPLNQDESKRGGSFLKIQVKCGKGTYIRSLAHDIGQELGCGAYLEKLTRTKIGKFTIKKSLEIEKLNSKNLSKYLNPVNII